MCAKASGVINPMFVAFDLALAALAIRSVWVIRGRSPLTALGWTFAVGYGLAKAAQYALPGLGPGAGRVAYGCLLLMAVAFVVAGIRDERQAEPLLWPLRLGQTRAERRAPIKP